jgi:hypothetical protein
VITILSFGPMHVLAYNYVPMKIHFIKKGYDKMYTIINFQTKKSFKEAVANGKEITLFAPGIGTPKQNGIEYVEGPWYPAAHSWWSEVEVVNGIVTKVK